MKWISAPRALVLMFLLMLSLGALGAQAQSGNLLVNPGFEPPYVDNGGTPPRLVAQGWAPWNLPAEPGMSYSQMLQPEYYPANSPSGLGPARVRTGSESQRMQIFFGTFTAGVSQAVGNLASGQQYTFGAQVYVWSSSFDDPAISQQDGGVTVQVGIDPTGGSDSESASIVWSGFATPRYDSWVFYSVTAPVTSSTASVWIRATVTTPVKNTVVFMDDGLLVQGTSAGLPASATTVPPTATAVPASSTPVAPTATPSMTLTPTITLTPSPYPTVNNTQFPGRTVYIVKQNDTVAIIAAAYGTSIDAILAANNLSANGLIFVGQSLIIPLTSGVPATAQPTSVPPTPIPPTSAPPTPAPTAAPVTTYVVRPGDTLFGIALRFNTTVSALQRANNISNPNLIYVGQRLIIPPPGSTGAVPTAITVPSNSVGIEIPPTNVSRTHTVMPGDNLYSIAIRYNTTVAAIADANDIANPNLIFVGEVLTIP
ncbi:MAG: LysM peptidoglycan-binding domain-containing protein [Anaerolineae bacterium]